MSNSFTVSMISVSQIYTNRFSKQKYKFSAWISVNLTIEVVGMTCEEILRRDVSGLPPCFCARTYCISSCCWLISNRANNFSPICLPDSDMSRTANFPCHHLLLLWQNGRLRLCKMNLVTHKIIVPYLAIFDRPAARRFFTIVRQESSELIFSENVTAVRAVPPYGRNGRALRLW